jgi:hypothetical protein
VAEGGQFNARLLLFQLKRFHVAGGSCNDECLFTLKGGFAGKKLLFFSMEEGLFGSRLCLCLGQFECFQITLCIEKHIVDLFQGHKVPVIGRSGIIVETLAVSRCSIKRFGEGCFGIICHFDGFSVNTERPMSMFKISGVVHVQGDPRCPSEYLTGGPGAKSTEASGGHFSIGLNLAMSNGNSSSCSR